MSDRECPVCGKVARRCGPWQYCWDCFNAASLVIRRARAAVYDATRTGALPRAATLTCADCGAPGFGYDHRDYERPLEVDPVCRKCNFARGPAMQLSPGFRVSLPAREPAKAAA